MNITFLEDNNSLYWGDKLVNLSELEKEFGFDDLVYDAEDNVMGWVNKGQLNLVAKSERLAIIKYIESIGINSEFDTLLTGIAHFLYWRKFPNGFQKQIERYNQFLEDLHEYQERNEVELEYIALGEKLQNLNIGNFKNHCYWRIANDTVCGQKWDTKVAKPFYKNADFKLLEASVLLLNIMLETPSLIHTLNQVSLTFRKK